MRAPRVSVFLPRPTGFYRGLLPQMLSGFEQAGFEVSGTSESLGEAEIMQWCRSHQPDVVLDMNRTRSQVPYLPRDVVHVSWIVDFLGRTEEQIQGSDLTYYPGELAEKARFYLARPALCDRLRQNARSLICEHHTWRHRALKVKADLQGIGAARASSA